MTDPCCQLPTDQHRQILRQFWLESKSPQLIAHEVGVTVGQVIDVTHQHGPRPDPEKERVWRNGMVVSHRNAAGEKVVFGRVLPFQGA